ncbi:inositol 3-kinase-like [Aristolochia californica]|uniref:inositol 3-kinase-like n=1 Tax=Aristolochia californica TaxID=171875 RepID=UPI0035DC35BD
MVRLQEEEATAPRGCGLVVGNYCHDVILRDGRVVGESLGGAASFVSNVLDGLSLPCSYVAKVGIDFAYSVTHPPRAFCSAAPTTIFHAHFDGDAERVLRCVKTCDPIFPSDLPVEQFDFGLAVGVAGEILPETLARMLDLCRLVFVDAQALIRTFDPHDGTVRLIPMKGSGFQHLLPRIGFLKASAEEAPFVDVQETRKWCCVAVTDGEDGCRVYCKDEELRIPPFPTVQIDPTGAGDSFLGGFVAGLMRGLSIPDAALLGNFFGSMNVGQIGIPISSPKMFQRVKELLERKTLDSRSGAAGTVFQNSEEFEEFRICLSEASKLEFITDQEIADGHHLDMENFSKAETGVNQDIHSHRQPPKLFVSSVYEAT